MCLNILAITPIRLQCYSIRTGLEDGTILASPSDFPAFLWRNEKMNRTDPFEGFLRGEILVKVSTASAYVVT